MLLNSLALVGAKFGTLALGFLAWLLAARLYEPSVVGLATAVVSAVTLAVQLALLGSGSAVITLLPARGPRPAALLDTALTIGLLAAVAVTALLVVFAGSALSELGTVARDGTFALVFVAYGVLGTLGVVLDQASTALGRGVGVLARAGAAGAVTIALVVVSAGVASQSDVVPLVVAWLAGAAVSVVLGFAHLRMAVGRYVFRPRVARGEVRELLDVGLRNHALTLAERSAPALLPIVVTEILSPQANAAWYAAWMMAWAAFVIPTQVGINVFAEAARRPEGVRRAVLHGLATSVVLGVAAAAALALLAEPALALLGASYAADGAAPLRVLVIGVLPFAIVQAYYAACRAGGLLREATIVAVAIALASLVAAVVAAGSGDLTAVAAAWVAVQCIGAAWAASRLPALLERGSPRGESHEAAAHPAAGTR